MLAGIVEYISGVLEVIPSNYEVQVSTNQPTNSQPHAYIQVDVRNPSKPPGKRLVSRQMKMSVIHDTVGSCMFMGRRTGNEICKELK